MKKLAVFCLAAMLLALSACGPDDASRPGAGAQPEASVSSEPEATPTEEPESGYTGYDPTVSSPAYADNHMLLEDLREFGQNLPEEIWWLEEDRAREVFGMEEEATLSALCGGGLIQFFFRIPYDQEALAPQHGMTAEALYGANGTQWRLAFEMAELHVTAAPAEGECPLPDTWEPGRWTETGENAGPEPAFPDDSTPPPDLPVPELTECPMSWSPVQGHEGFERTDCLLDESGQVVRVRLRWRLGEHWAMAELPAHCLEGFLEKEPELWTKVDTRSPGQASQPEPEGPVASVSGEDG